MQERRELKCILFPLDFLSHYEFVAVCSYFNGKWMLSKHKDRNCWEHQGGHIESNEDPLETAKRELYEESGATNANFVPLCDYIGYHSNRQANGKVYLAIIKRLNDLPQSEMERIDFFTNLPSELTYPNVTPKFFEEAKKALKLLNIE